MSSYEAAVTVAGVLQPTEGMGGKHAKKSLRVPTDSVDCAFSLVWMCVVDMHETQHVFDLDIGFNLL